MSQKMVYKPITTTGGTFSITVTQTATALTVPTDASRLVYQVETADIRVSYNGVAPVAGVGGGFLQTTNADYSVDGWDSLNGMRVIRETSTSARMTGQFFTKE